MIAGLPSRPARSSGCRRPPVGRRPWRHAHADAGTNPDRCRRRPSDAPPVPSGRSGCGLGDDARCRPARTGRRKESTGPAPAPGTVRGPARGEPRHRAAPSRGAESSTGDAGMRGPQDRTGAVVTGGGRGAASGACPCRSSPRSRRSTAGPAGRRPPCRRRWPAHSPPRCSCWRRSPGAWRCRRHRPPPPPPPPGRRPSSRSWCGSRSTGRRSRGPPGTAGSTWRPPPGPPCGHRGPGRSRSRAWWWTGPCSPSCTTTGCAARSSPSPPRCRWAPGWPPGTPSAPSRPTPGTARPRPACTGGCGTVRPTSTRRCCSGAGRWCCSRGRRRRGPSWGRSRGPRRGGPWRGPLRQPRSASVRRARSRSIAAVCICEIRDSVTPSTRPISARVMPS